MEERAIVRVLSADDHAYARCRLDLAERRVRAAALQTEVDDLTRALNRFAAECHARLAGLFVDLDRARAAVAVCERRIARLRGTAHAARQPVEAPAADEPSNGEERATGDRGRRGRGTARREWERAHREREATELRTVYRDLARRFHPDLAPTETERLRRADLMRRINAAYHARDLGALRGMLRAAQAAEPLAVADTLLARLAAARRELAQLDVLIRDLMAERGALQGTETFRLYQRREAGAPVIDGLVADVAREIARQRRRLREMTDLHARLRDNRARERERLRA